MANGNERRPARPRKQWTILVYMAGDNNLDSAGVADLTEMKKVGSTDAVDVIVQFDRAGSAGVTKRYRIRKGTPLEKDVVQRLGETNCGDPAVLQGFIEWGCRTYPAERFLLVLWNHGAGWDDSNVYIGEPLGGAPPPVVRKASVVRNPRSRQPPVHERQMKAALRRTDRALFRTTAVDAVRKRAIAFDDDAKDFLDNLELKRVLASTRKAFGGRLALLGMDACLMSMLEVAYQVRGSVGVVVASQETEPGEGWPYDRILKRLAGRPTQSAADLSAAIVDEYLASYRSTENVTQSALDLSRVSRVKEAVAALAKTLRERLPEPAVRGAIVQARAVAQEYSAPYDDYCDLKDLCGLLSQGTAVPEVKAACGAVQNAVDAFVIGAGSKGDGVSNSHGVSIYFPKRKLSPLYGKLDFARNTGWDEFLVEYLAGTRSRKAVAA